MPETLSAKWSELESESKNENDSRVMMRMVREKEKEEWESYGVGWVFPSRLVYFAPKLPLSGSLVATLHRADTPLPYPYLPQLLAGRPTAEPTVNALLVFILQFEGK